MSAYETITDIPGVTVELHQDLEPFDMDPRDNECNGATIACRNDNRSYDFGDKAAEFDLGRFESWAEVRQHLIDVKGAIPGTMVGLAVTDHSGLHLHVDVPDGSNAGDQWDTAFIGWAYVTPAQADEMGHGVGVDIETGETSTGFMLREIALAEAREYGCYLAGDVNGYVIKDAATGEELESCWGFLGDDYVREAAREAGQGVAADLAATVADLEYRAQVDLTAAFALAAREALIAA